MKGNELKREIDTFIEDNAKYMPIASKILKRVGHDVHPDSSLFWGMFTDDIKQSRNSARDFNFDTLPTEANGWSGLTEVGKAQYVKETRWLQQVWEHSFAKARQSDCLQRVRQPFQCGLYKDVTMQGNDSDGVLNYWCLLSMTRPTDEQHRTEVEEWLNNSYLSLWKNNVAWDVVLQEVREYIEEAKVLGLRIKWMSTGRRFMQALQRDNKMCFELMPFKKGGPDPQDCILHLEELVGVIEANVAESQEASKAKKNAMIAQVLAAQTDEDSQAAWNSFMRDDCQQAMFMQRRIREASKPHSDIGPGVCRHYAAGNTCRFGDRCKFEHTIAERQKRRPDTGFYPEGKFSSKTAFNGRPAGTKCFADKCSQPKNSKGAFCLECHRRAVKKGGIRTRDGQWRSFPLTGGQQAIKRANMAATEDSQVFWVSQEGMAIEQEIWDDAVQRNDGFDDATLDKIYEDANADEPNAMQAIMDGGHPFAYDYSARPLPQEDNEAHFASGGEKRRSSQEDRDDDAKRPRNGVPSAASIVERVRARAAQHGNQ